MNINLPNFTEVSPELPLRRYNGDCAYFAVTPTKGARIAGTFLVTATSHEKRIYDDNWPAHGKSHGHSTATLPGVLVDPSPHLVDSRGNTVYRDGTAVHPYPLTINGVDYTSKALTTFVYFAPMSASGNRDTVHQRVTFDGMNGYLMTDRYPTDMTDSARQLFSRTVEAIAVQWLTEQRWHAHKIELASNAVKNAESKLADAQATLDNARDELAKLTAAEK